MIKKPTTFIVGAGGSKPYGFPLGGELFGIARALTPRSAVYAALRETRIVEVEALNQILEDMRVHPAPSIDAYLLTRQDESRHPGYVRAGKGLLALLMADATTQARNHRVKLDEDWLGRVIGEMLADAATLSAFLNGNCRVRFVTFNFESVIEERLDKEVLRAFGNLRAGDQIVRNMVQVIHVHGVLPPLPASPMENPMLGEVPREWTAWTRSAIDQLNIIHDACDDVTLTRAREAVREAEIVCFLGCHYHLDNLKRLDAPASLGHAEVFGSALHLPEGRRPRVVGRTGGRIQLADSRCDALATLDLFNIFRD